MPKFPAGAPATRIYDQEGITIDAHLVDHDPVKPALGYVIGYQGKKVFIGGDTKGSPRNLPAMQDADLVVHEAYAAHLVRRAIPVLRDRGMALEAEVAERTIGYHSDTIDLAIQAEQAHVKPWCSPISRRTQAISSRATCSPREWTITTVAS